MAKQIFISYSSSDGEFVGRLIADLQAAGIEDIWIDKIGLKPGTRNWEQAVRDAIRDAAAVLLVASPSSRQSNYVQGELEIAKMYDRRIYPIWANGEKWPESIPLDMTKMQYVDARGGRYGIACREIVEILGLAPAQTRCPAPSPEVDPGFEPRNPYKGLRPFTEDDRGDFFGRDALIAELIGVLSEKMAEDRARLLAVIGPSGSGKSSVVMAGVVPRLREGALPGSEGWHYPERIVPGLHPLESLLVALARELPEKSSKVVGEDLYDPEGRGLHLLGRQIVRQAGRRLVLFVDQFEELFNPAVDEDERRQFISLLVTAVTEPKGPVTVVLTLRADFYGRPMAYARLWELVETHQPVRAMSIEDLRDVIEKPAALADVRLSFEEGLVGDLLFEVRGQAGGLPLLQFALDQLFERRDGQRLTMAAYREIGGVRGAVAQHAEATYGTLPGKEHRRLARWLFLRLIDPGVSAQDITRRRAELAELRLSDTVQAQTLGEVADAFVRARLLTTSRVAEKEVIEVSHEALIREWRRLGEWLEEARADVEMQQAISTDAAAWDALGSRPGDDRLYRGEELKDALGWAERNMASARESAFLHAAAALDARKRQEDRERREREEATARRADENEMWARRSRRAALVLAIVGLLAIGAGIWAINRRQDAIRDAAIAGQTVEASNRQIVVAQTSVAEAKGAAVDAAQRQAIAEGALATATRSLVQAKRQATAVAGQASTAAAQAHSAQSTLAVVETHARTAESTLVAVEARSAIAVAQLAQMFARDGTVPVGRDPGALAWDGESLWVANGNSDTVMQIDPASGSVVATIQVGNGPVALAWDGESLWIANWLDDTVVQIDPLSRERVLIVRVTDPIAVAWDGAGLWIASRSEDTVVRIDPAGGDIVANIPVGRSPEALAWDGASLWVANYASDTVMRIDPVDSATVETIPVGNGPEALAWDGASLWVANVHDNTVVQIDPAAGEVVSTVEVGVGPRALAWDGAGLWVANISEDTVMQLDPVNGAPVATIKVGDGPTALAWDGVYPWVTNLHSDTVMRINLTQSAYLATIEAGGSPTALAWDGESLWVANSRLGISDLGVVRRIDPEAGSVVARVDVGRNLFALAWDGVSLWVANRGEDQVVQIDTDSEAVSRAIDVGADPKALAWDGSTLWVANNDDGTVMQIDPESGDIVQTVPVGKRPEALLWDGESLWVANCRDGTVMEIAPMTGQVSSIISAGRCPAALAWDGESLWVANWTDGTVMQIDPVRGVPVTTVRVGERPAALAWDGAILWVANRGLDSGIDEPDEGTLMQIDPSIGAIVSTLRVGQAPFALEWDGNTLWVANQYEDTVMQINARSLDLNAMARRASGTLPLTTQD